MKRFTRIIAAICLSGALLLLSCCSGAAGGAKHGLPSKEISILFTGDVHCAVDDNIGYAALAEYKNTLIKNGNDVLLLDSGDAVQGAPLGVFSNGESLIKIMNELGYDAMALGNHEFDYGTLQLSKLADEAEFPFLSLNFIDNRTGSAVYKPYIIKDCGGVKVAILGVSTPHTVTSSTPAYFMDDNGKFVFGFMQGKDGTRLYDAVQATVDSAVKDGADYVVALTHLGIEASDTPFMSTDLIANTGGIDVVLDGHSHTEMECERVKNINGEEVILASTGTKLEKIGVLTIGTDGTITSKLVSDLTKKDAAVEGFINDIKGEYAEKMGEVTANVKTYLRVADPATGIRIVRNAETNLGDLCADAYRAAADADIAFVNGGGIRAELKNGDITYGEILNVFPFGNMLCKVKATGQEILDALEHGAASVPTESGGFLQVSGLTYQIDTSVPSSVELDENGLFVKMNGEYRVKNVTVGGAPLDLAKEYTLVSHNYLIKNFGDGYSMFADNEMILDEFIDDYAALTNYINNEYAANPQAYDNPYGQERITAYVSPENED